MTGREFVGALEAQGFAVRRRSKRFVWLARGEQTLMVDEEAAIPEAFLQRLLDCSGPPPSASSRRPSQPHSGQFRVSPKS